MIARTLALLALVLGLVANVQAQQPAISAEDQAAIRDTIQGQIEAFGRDDADAAFGYASPSIQGMFGRSDVFMDMVRQGYRPVYRPKVVDLHGQLAQKVHVVGPDGRPVTAVYPMTQLPDGSWRIDGCYLLAPDEHQA